MERAEKRIDKEYGEAEAKLKKLQASIGEVKKVYLTKKEVKAKKAKEKKKEEEMQKAMKAKEDGKCNDITMG